MTQLSDQERPRTRPAVAGRVTREQPSEALVAACLAGEQDAWSKLVRRYSPLVRTVARSHRLSTADCDEVCQLTWLRVYENLAQLRCAASFPAWVTTCARRESVKQLGRAARYIPVGDSTQLDRHGGGPVVDDSGPEGSWIGSELRGEVLAALRE
ncbi:sigma-70 family RNA polymerase sigma factor, partial [Streptomyces sp. T-3]|nr:sigma-70 family RNA polymerase sigma factor [Streptomyces sp. T-3]